jgi:tetratricopeptide (TPR) repeat protein
MTEVLEPENGPEPDSGSGSISSSAAMALGIRKARSGGKPDPKFDAFLDRQTRLLDLQTEHLHEQRELMLSRLRWGRFSDRLKALLQGLTVLVGTAVAGAIAVMAWQAHEDHGATIEAFSVPPDFAQRGLTGQVVASQLLDRIAEFQARTVTLRPASSYANDWGGDIKVEIPETGVSIGEMNRYLREWLGSQTRISGEIVRTPAGVAVTARAGDAPGRRFEGPEADVDKLIAQAAEGVYAQTQRYRYAVYLQSSGRLAEAEAEYIRLAEGGSPEDRPWALTGWASVLSIRGDDKGAAEKAEEAIRAAPGLSAAYRIAIASEAKQFHSEAAIEVSREAMLDLHGLDKAFFDPPLNEETGDFHKAGLEHGAETLSSEGRSTFLRSRELQASDFAHDHEVSRARQAFARLDPADSAQALTLPTGVEAECRFAMDDWGGILELWGSRRVQPWMAAIAFARIGRLGEAQALAAGTPPDCDSCVIARGVVAAAAHDWTAADRWFDDVTRRAPSAPLAPTEWGRSLLAKGDFDGAVAKLTEAHRRGPHYADPVELLGEALMKKGDVHGAIAKFAEADPDAPRWGRNHLLWGEALMLSGQYAEARRQYEAASGMDLSRPDRAALDVLLARTASGPLHV